MTWFNNLKLATKLMLAFGLVAALAGVVGYQGIQSMGRIDDMLHVIYDRHALGLLSLKNANIEIIKISRAVRNALLDEDAAAIEKRIEDIKQFEASFFKAFGDYQQRIVRAEIKAKAAEVERLFKELRPRQDAIVKLAREGHQAQARAGRAEIRAAANDLDARIHELEADKVHQMEKAAENAKATYESTRRFVLTVIAVVVVLAIGLGLFITRLLTKQLGGEPTYAMEVTTRIASGDLISEIVTRQGDNSSLLANMQMMGEKLRQIVGKIREGSANITAAAGEIAQGNSDLSQRTQEQASALEETAASVEEMTSTVKQNADNARQANQLATGAREQAEKGGEVVGRAVAAMSEINASSKKIADIIGVIDSIAFQTNLLALNAAVEAARAGEQGRGFAVVAAEVRKLAQRSADAAKEIKTLINDSVEKIAGGSQLVEASGEALEEIVTGVKKVSDIVAEIAAASQEQAAGIEQVNKAVTQMDEVTQQNAALVEEMASASESMDEQAKALQRLMAESKVDEQAAEASSAVARSAQPQPTSQQPAVATSAALRHSAPGKPATVASRANRRQPVKAAPVPESDEGEWTEF